MDTISRAYISSHDKSAAKAPDIVSFFGVAGIKLKPHCVPVGYPKATPF